MKKLQSITVFFWGLLLFFTSAPAEAVVLGLFDASFNLNGAEVPLGDPLPAGFTMDSSAFDFSTGLGTLSIRFSPGAAGNYYVAGFFDHEIDEVTNTYFNETGAAVGTPMAGQSWEIDEPGYLFGDIYDNTMDATLDNQIFDGDPTMVDDVSMAMGWDFFLPTDLHVATIDFILSETAPTSGFYLVHSDPDSQYSIYFSSELTVSAIPEPGTLLLVGSGLAGLALLSRRRNQADKKNR